MRQLNRFKSIKALLVVMAMPVMMAFGLGDVMADGYLNKTQKLAENIWVGPQVSEKELKSLKAEQFTQVINFRTVEEMTALSFDESEVLKAEGIDYQLIPLGKNLGYTPQQLSEFNQVMQNQKEGDAKILMHCRSGYRANLMYAAWLIKYKNMDKAAAKKAVHAWSDESIDALLGAEAAAETASK
mgnify:FL=1